jgi:hypothetical protein
MQAQHELTPGQARTAKARETLKERTARLAVDDPARLEKAARIIRAALARAAAGDLSPEQQAALTMVTGTPAASA